MFSKKQKPGRPDPLVEEEEEEYEYKAVQWKDFVTKPKYIRGCFLIVDKGPELMDAAWHILGIAVLVGSILLAIHHDQVVEVCKNIYCQEEGSILIGTGIKTDFTKNPGPSGRLHYSNSNTNSYLIPTFVWTRTHCSALRCGLRALDWICHCSSRDIPRRE
jgi:hypothetical protein